MRTVLISLTFFVAAVSPAAAAVPHVVQPGETLWTIASANNFTTRAFAAANGLSENSPVIVGSTLKVPSVAEAAAAPGAAPAATGSAPVAAAAPKPLGGYIVQPGDTLSGLAGRPRQSRSAATSSSPATRCPDSPRAPASRCSRWRS